LSGKPRSRMISSGGWFDAWIKPSFAVAASITD
jgi:hypothetical protein